MALENFSNMVNTQFNVKIKILRSDNSSEFILFEFYQKLEIIYQTYCVETPQRNGLVERKHQHLLQVARSLLQSSLPLKHLSFYIQTASHLINRIPSYVLHDKTPF